MKKFIFVLLISFAFSQTAHSSPLLHLFNKKKLKEVQLVAETYGPAAFKCYYQVTRGADFTLDNFKKAYASGKMNSCLQTKIAEQAEYLKEVPNAIHR